jgi:hypothetical protein
MDAKKSGTQLTSNVEKELLSLLNSKAASVEVTRAYDIFSHTYKKEVMESFLLVDATTSEIQDILKVPESVTEVYKHLFFDPEVFEDELDRINYAHTYPGDEYGQKLKRFAVNLGKESLKIKMSRGAYAVNAVEVQDGIRSTAYLMGQLVRANPLDSKIARESLRWAQLGLKAAVEDETDKDAGGIDKVKFALESRDETTDAEKSGIEQEDILH